MPHVLVYRECLLPPSETFILQQATLLRRWQPTLFGLSRPTRGLPLSGVSHHVVTLGGRELGTWPHRARRVAERLGWTQAAAIRQARRLRPQLIHAHFGVDAVSAHRLARALDVPLLVTLHGYDVSVRPAVWRHGAMGPALTRYPDQLKAMAADPRVSFTAVSSALKDIAVAQFRLPAERIRVMHLGIDPDRFPPSPVPMRQRPPKVLFVGRMVEKKAPQVLLQALARIQGAGMPCEATFIGDGPLLADMQALATTLDVDARFLGVQGSAVVAAELETARLFCLPSVRAANGDAEGLGIALLEAQARGVPVVTSAVGGRDEGILPGLTGVAFPEGDVAALTQAIRTLLHDEPTLTAMAERGRRFILEAHDARTWGRALEVHYDALTRGTP